MDKNLKIFSGRSNPVLAQKIADSLGINLGVLSIKTFSDGELWIKFEENIRGRDVFIIQPTNSPAENILELVLIIDAAVRASANTVTAVIPYFGYGRQDRKDNPRVPISSRVMVDLMTATGADRIITMDLHSTQIQGFATIPFDHLYSRMVLMDAITNLGFDPKKSAVLAPDVGSARMSQAYAKRLGMHFALIDKRRYAPNKAEVMHLIGELKDKDVLIIDDMIDTAGTTVNAANAAKENGAKSVTAIATHAILSGLAIDRIKESAIEKLVVTDTVSIPENKKLDNMEIVSVAQVFGEAIRRVYDGESVSALFEF
ncbi:MAG: ribose-phosphate pyrophosphokinase [Candidatus Marinimicrobia bacterium]|jgi:ribose-phosphate pyrophosphokinase|nr:ribose-phosphate pyrophosphokinase [Candidatus Neomarinimicrobiota bacterium]MBT3947767.1 ribose-phosphate pyrophosphokinase [Candidatus Neomarinimicrobiota bacterium]MBT4064615.1 ribose-phosphate pyrophosphokinase [Candidatus Neomarinimicrobiota bacterium]MBT4307657.1 ribose-phosphate pyrophosphokinase [Candidatus Neomarinimicrobiota bacterium]MBT4453581.1 ribose-phosphate pyrophosphokinase [Candidatus Neomarinimicrobiota bacterium]|tara:strand:+ start:151 stop:1095 length:945 start_codon:yes stop_codon:yes gene_type:complete